MLFIAKCVILFILIKLLQYLSRSKRVIVVSIEGNIGVGKSTLINYLKSNNIIKNASYVSEPVNTWDTSNILSQYYNDKKRWGFTFQHFVYITRIIDTIKTLQSNKPIIILDRSLTADKNVFELMLYENKIINRMEHSIYTMWCDFYEQYIDSKYEHKTIYLKCDPVIAHKRIQARGRPSELSINIADLTKLNDYHERMISGLDNEVLTIDYNNTQIDENLCNRIISFIS